MKNDLFEKLTRGCIYTLVFLMPLFFLPISLDVLEVNKQTLLVALSFGAALCWVGDMLMKGTLRYHKGWLNISPLLLLVCVLISATLSQGKYLSFLGAASQEYMSALTMIALVTLFYVVLNTLHSAGAQRAIAASLVFSSTLVAILGAGALYGLFYLPFEFAASPTFNTIGTVNALGVYLAVMAVFACGLWLAHSEKNMLFYQGLFGKVERLFVFLLCVITLFIFIGLDYWMLWTVLLAGLSVLLSFVILRAKEFHSPSSYVLPLSMATISVLFLLWVPPIFQPSVPIEVTPSFSLSWEITTSALADTSALFGSGPGTFMFSWAKYHGPEINATDFWDVRFDRASSFALTTAVSLGVLGAIAWLLFLFAVSVRSMRVLIQEKTRSLWMPALIYFAPWAALVVGASLYSSNMTLVFALMLFSALLCSLTMEEMFQTSLKKTPRIGYAFSALFVFASLLFVFLIFVSTQRYFAEAAFSKAVRLDREGASVDEVLESLDAAATLVRFNDIYYRNLAQALLLKLGEETAALDPQTALSEERSAYMQALTEAAVNASVRATDLSPSNVLNWLMRAGVYRELIGLVTGADEQTLYAYDQAVALEENNPFTFTEVAKTYLIMVDALTAQAQSDDPDIRETAQGEIGVYLSRAENVLNHAIELKPDYAPAHYQLAIVFEQQGRLSEAVGKMESVAEYNPLDVGVYFQLGLLYLRRNGEGDLEKAQKAFETAVYLAPSYSNARWFLASIYEEQGRFDEAIDQVEMVLEVNPGDTLILKRLQDLREGKAEAELPPVIEEIPPAAEPLP